MNTARAGSFLKIDIRLALLSLGRDHQVDLSRITIAEGRALLAELRAEQRKVGGILKEGV